MHSSLAALERVHNAAGSLLTILLGAEVLVVRSLLIPTC